MNIKGYEFKPVIIKDSYNRRAVQYKNKIITLLKHFGITDDDIEIELEPMAMKKVQASVSWYMWDDHLFYSFNEFKFAENLAMIEKVLEHFVNLLVEKKITPEEFLNTFTEEDDIHKKRKEAREILGVDKNSTDYDEINKQYRKLSRKHHPDMPDGNAEEFQKINKAHKILKKEFNK